MVLDPAEVARRLLQVSPVAVLVADRRGQVVAVSEAGRRLLGLAAEGPIGKLHVLDLFERRDAIRRVVDRARRGGPGWVDPVDATIRTVRGEAVPVRVHPALLKDARGAVVGTLGAFVDRRESLDLDRRLAQLGLELEEARGRLLAAATVEDAYHELAQPLTVALGQTEMAMMDDDMPPAVMERLERVRVQLERMRRIVFSRTGRGGAERGG